MKLHTVDWAQFFRALPLYLGLPVDARHFLVHFVKPSQPVPNTQMGKWREALLSSGLMVPGTKGLNATINPEYRDFCRTLTAMSDSQVFDTPCLETFEFYVEEYFSTDELGAFNNSRNYTRSAFESLRSVHSLVTSAVWPRAFLAATSTDWEVKYHSGSGPYLTSPPAVLTAAQHLLRSIMQEHDDGQAQVPLSRLPQLLPDVEPITLAGALRVTFRYMMLFAALSDEDLVPVIGAWPGLAKRLNTKPPQPPAPVEVSQPFQSLFLMDDMVAILSACVLEPIRLRSGDRNLFEASRQALGAALAPLPSWLDEPFHLSLNYRIEHSIDYLTAFGFVKLSGRPGTNYSFRATDSGVAWLSRSSKERLKAMLDTLRDARAEDVDVYDNSLPLVPGLSMLSTGANTATLQKAALSAFASLPVGSWFRLVDFLNFQGRVKNALTAAVVKNQHMTLTFGGRYLHSPTEEDLDIAWQRILHEFLRLRLLPLGGVKVGMHPGTAALSFSVTPIGSYLLGAASDFEMADDTETRFLIQPNFDIVFLAPSATLEAELSRFAERRGHHVGTLFRITKASIFNAAASGATSERVLATLRDHSQTGVPPNVESEITGWFARYRQIDIRPAVLIHCPDDETAARVSATLGKAVTRIGPTLLEFHQSKVPTPAVKKLREAGVFIRASQ